MMLCEAIPTPARANNMGASWSDEDDAQLAALHLQQPVVPIEAICTALGRIPSSVVARLARLRIRRVPGGKMRRCMNHRECGNTIYSTWAGDRYCYPCRKKLQELF